MLPARAVSVAAAAGLAACSPFGGGEFACTDSPQCGPSGACELNGFCSFPDATCGSGRRYGDGSGSLSGICVGDEPPDAPPGAPDARGDAPPGSPDASPPAAFCDPADSALRLCLAFEGNATDGSSAGNTPTTSNITFVAGQVGMAVATTDLSRIDVAETASLDVAHLSIETWINPVAIPTGGNRVGIVDNNGQWGIFIRANGDVQCSPVGGATAAAALTTGTWTHVACTYDGATLAVWVNGSIAASRSTSANLGTGGNTGTSIAGDNPPPNDRLTGALDQFRIFSEARSAAQICAAAGRTTCP